jgi:hypothetical protein
MSLQILPLSLRTAGSWKQVSVALEVDKFSSIVLQSSRDELIEIVSSGGIGLSVEIGGVISFRKRI